MGLMTSFRTLQAENEFLPILERMAQYAAPDKRAYVLCMLARMDQDMARHREELGGYQCPPHK